MINTAKPDYIYICPETAGDIPDSANILRSNLKSCKTLIQESVNLNPSVLILQHAASVFVAEETVTCAGQKTAAGI